MKTPAVISLIFEIIFFTVPASGAAENPASSLKLVNRISIPDVEGRIDHIAIDVNGHRLFVCALENNTVEVIDLNANIRIHTISGLAEPQGILFLPESNKLYITSGQTGRCDIFNADTFNQIGNIQFSSDADNIRYDPAAGLIYIGFGHGGLGVIDVKTDKQTGFIELAGHPEAFEIEAGTDRIFVNMPTASNITVLDRKKLKIETVWTTNNAGGNFPMAIDNTNHRLLVGCRYPPKLLIFDTRSGNSVSQIDTDGDADDIFCDPKNNRVFISCGNGYIDVLENSQNAGYKITERIPTAKSARTSLFAAPPGYLYLAVPARQGRHAQIWIYKTDMM